LLYLFFFSSRRRHTRSKRDWSSDVCSSDLHAGGGLDGEPAELAGGQVGELCGGVEEAVDLLGFDEALGEGAELVLVLLAAEGPGAERVGVRHGDAVLDHGAVGRSEERRVGG